MKKKQIYVVGFAFNYSHEDVILIQKQRPDWQKGKLNGIGGKVEPAETPLVAMRREFQEETGVIFLDWEEFCTMKLENDDVMHLFKAYMKDEVFYSARTQGLPDDEAREEVRWSPVISLPFSCAQGKTIPNIPWMVQMALSFERGEKVKKFEITEIPKK